MVIVFPMLCSNSVNRSALPGICSALERYILIHKLDQILKQTHKQVKKSRSRIQIKEDLDLNIDLDSFYILDEIDAPPAPSGGRKPRSASSTASDYEKMSIEELEAERERLNKEKEELEKNKEKIEDKEDYMRQRELLKKDLDEIKRKKKELEDKEVEIKDATTRVTMNMDSMSVEPTWMTVDKIIKGQKITDLLGIKVIPFSVQSDENLANLIMYDKNLSKINSLIVGLGRKIRKEVYDLYKRAVTRIPIAGRFLGRGTIKGDPRSDVLLAKSAFKDNIFVCLNKMDLDDDFFQSAGGIRQLQKLGWESFIVLDDVSKTAHFCMEEFKGVCYSVNYSYIFATHGSSQSKVYEDLNDVKKSSGGFFRMKTKPKKLFSEAYVNSLFEHEPELKVFSEMEKMFLNESDFKAKKEGLAAIRQLKDLVSTLKSKDINKIKANLDRKTSMKSLADMKSKMSKINPNFRKAYNLASKKLDKRLTSKRLDNNLFVLLASLIGLYSIRDFLSEGKGSLKHTESFINKINSQFDKNMKKLLSNEEVKKEDPDYLLGIAAVFSVIIIGIPALFVITYILIKTGMIPYFINLGVTIGELIISMLMAGILLLREAFVALPAILWGANAGFDLIYKILNPYDIIKGTVLDGYWWVELFS